VDLEPCLVGEWMGVGRPRGSSHERDNFGARVLYYTQRFHSWELTWWSNTMGKRRVEFGSGIGEHSPDLQFILDCFQEGLSEVGDAAWLMCSPVNPNPSMYAFRTSLEVHRER
jgi:hypothetical protein